MSKHEYMLDGRSAAYSYCTEYYVHAHMLFSPLYNARQVRIKVHDHEFLDWYVKKLHLIYYFKHASCLYDLLAHMSCN